MATISLKGKRGNYSLVSEGAVIATGTNRERLRGIQFFLESNPQYAAAPRLLAALKCELALDAEFDKGQAVFKAYGYNAKESGKSAMQWVRDNTRAIINEAEGKAV